MKRIIIVLAVLCVSLWVLRSVCHDSLLTFTTIRCQGGAYTVMYRDTLWVLEPAKVEKTLIKIERE